MQQVYGGSQNLHFRSHSCHTVPVPRQEHAYGTQLFSAVLDVPNLVVEVSELAKGNKNNIKSPDHEHGHIWNLQRHRPGFFNTDTKLMSLV